jgi:molecular chaperone DnaJ
MPDFDASIFGDFSDILGDLFGFGDLFGGCRRARRGPRRGADVGYDLELGLEEAVFGKEADVRLRRSEACARCGGSGAASPADIVSCPACGGSGQQAFRQGFLTIARTCGQCRGSGRAIRRVCEECRGAGQVQRDRTIRIRIPPGVESGNQMRVRGEGEGGDAGGQAGDLYVVIHVREHPVFTREERHLRCDVPVTFSQAALGAEVKVPVLGGGDTPLRIPAGTQTGSVLKVKGLGVKDGRGVGDLLVSVSVRTPTRLSKEGRKALQKLAESGDEAFSEEDRSIFGKVKDIFS